MMRPGASALDAAIRSLALALLILVGCDEGPASNVRYMHPSGSWDFLVEATDKGPLLLDIRGQPLDGRPEEVEATILALMSEAQKSRIVRFTRDPEQAAHPAYRVVVAFTGDAGLDSKALCGGELPGVGSSSQRIEAVASFCHEDDLLSSVHAWMTGGADSDDRRFHRMIRQMTRDLFAKAPPDR